MFQTIRRNGNVTQGAMMDILIQATRERNERYTVIPVDEWPDLYESGESVYLGSFSRLGMSTKRRWVQRSTSIVVGEHLATPTDIARDYIKAKYTRKLRATKDQIVEFNRPRHHPLYAVPCTIDEAVYVDLKSAFWSILQAIGWDVEYKPGKLLGVGRSMEDFPFSEHKLARNSLPTVGKTMDVFMWDWETKRPKRVRRGNAYANLGVWAAIQDVLNGVACDVVNAGALYVHTDGYICDSTDLVNVVNAIEGWGLPWSIKHSGPAKIYAAGAYDIGDKVTKRHVNRERETDTLRREWYNEWLRAKILWAAGHVFAGDLTNET